jgi:hypothetical protein
MTMLRELREPTVEEASENLRVIRELMERSTRYSTFSGLSGVLAGAASIAGCLVTQHIESGTTDSTPSPLPFLLTWAAVMLFAIGCDYLLTKRHAARVGKRILSRLGKQMAFAAVPGLASGALLTLLLLRHHLLGEIYGVWMLCYGIAVCAVGLFSQREVKYLGAAFLAAGALALLVPRFGLATMALSFGGFHIVYGIAMARKDGW